MKNAFLVTLVILAGLAAVALAHSRAHRANAAADSGPSKLSASREAAVGGEAKGTGKTRVIRFVKNPTPMPPFLVNDLDGRILSTADLHGKVVLLNFWATWCPPCREEIPELIELANRYKDKLVIIGVSMDDGPASEVRAFAKKAGINYPIIMDSKEVEDPYGGVPGLPTSFVINQDGRIVQKHQGLYPIDIYDGEIRSLLGMPVDAKVETFEDTGQIFLKNAAQATDLPDVDFGGLTPEQKKAALKRMNSEGCTCGCKLTIAQCRINDDTCATSKGLAASIVTQVKSGKSPPSLPDNTASPSNTATKE